jgi:hypothetical protein
LHDPPDAPTAICALNTVRIRFAGRDHDDVVDPVAGERRTDALPGLPSLTQVSAVALNVTVISQSGSPSNSVKRTALRPRHRHVLAATDIAVIGTIIHGP